MSLKQKTIKGLFWSGISQFGKQGSQFVITVILARLLSPGDFGLLAMVTVFVNFAMIFSEMGISSALIQKLDTHDRHFYSAFWLNIFVGLFLMIVFVVSAPLVALFFKKPELTSLLRLVSINFFIASFVVIQQTLLTKEMDFKKLAVRDMTAVIIAGVIGIILAYHGFGVLSLVWQLIAFTTFNAILLWILSPWRPKFQFAWSDIKDILRFSANLTGFNVINYFGRNVDQLLIGKFLGAQALGYYSLAYKLVLFPVQNISGIIMRVMFPAFSRIHHEFQKLRTGYLKMLQAIALITFPLMFSIALLSKEMTNVLWGDKWQACIPLLSILAICGAFQSLGTTVGSIYLSQGKAGLQFRLQVVGTALSVGAILFGLRWGVIGVAICYTIQSFLWVNYNLLLVGRLINFKLRDFFLLLQEPISISVQLLIVIILVKLIFQTDLKIMLVALPVSLFVWLFSVPRKLGLIVKSE